MNVAEIVALCTGIAGVLTSVAAVLHSMHTRVIVANTGKSATTPPATTSNFDERTGA